MNKKVVVLGILAVCLSISIGIGFSYALWNQTEIQEGTNRFQSGCFSISYKDDNNIINFNNAYPIPDEKGIQQKAYTFTIKNTCTIYAHFSVNLEKLSISNMEDKYVKLQLNNRRPMLYSAYNAVTTALDNTSSSRSLDFGGLEPEAERTYSLRLWIDNEATNDQVGGKSFQALISVVSAAAEPTGAEYIENLLATNTETMANDDPDENVRYIGANPNNYVNFNDELWRIIGVFYVKSSEEGPYEKRLKIIRNEPIGNYSWDSSEASINDGRGVNEWSQAALKELLNETYYDSTTSDKCYYSSNNVYTNCNFSQKSQIRGLDEDAKNMVSETLWNTGALDGKIKTFLNANTKDLYTAERSNYNEKICVSGTSGCNDTVQRTTKWLGKVGLMYPSDYGYAAGGRTTNSGKTREECLNYKLDTLEESDYKADCVQNNWLFNSNYRQWTITSTPRYDRDGGAATVFDVTENGSTDSNSASLNYGVRPVVYLKSDVQIIHDKDHDGSEGKPYELSL